MLNDTGSRLDFEVDRQLVSVATSFDRLLAVTPVDADEAWAGFAARGCTGEPSFHYRDVPVDLDNLAETLAVLPMDDVSDPALAELFRKKQTELELAVRLVASRNTDAFLPLSVDLYGGVDKGLVEVADHILSGPRPAPQAVGDSAFLDAEAFADEARREVARYRQVWPLFDATVQIRDDVPGVMCSQGHLLVSRRVRLSATRVEALVHHEVGTHLVTHANGRVQPLGLLQVGLPGAEETQEGLAVLAEYVVGGLTPSRLVLLAARVMAVERLLAGAAFSEAFARLHVDYGLQPERSFRVVMRVYRAGGLTKDAVYLRGLDGLLRHLGSGGDMADLFVGKLALDCLGLVSRLRDAGLVVAPPLEPRWLSHPRAADRFEQLRAGMGLLDLWEEARA